MKRRTQAMAGVALAFGLAGVVAGCLSSSGGAHPGPVDGVRMARVWGGVLPDLSGTRQPLAQWQGKVVVLNFWAPWCPPCREEIPGFIRLQAKYGVQGLQFVGVALDEPERVAPCVERLGVNYPVLLGGTAAMMLGRAAGNRLGGLPYTLVLDRRGDPVGSVTGSLDEARLERLIRPLL
jgi:thiol-disulfide isomerase/thioredoxin